MAKKIKRAINKFKEKGLLVPSSKKLAKSIVKEADLKRRKVIVEFGSGNGVFTQEILKAKPELALYFALELDYELAEETKKNCPSAIVYNDSAIQLAKYLKHNEVEKCDCIISGLPFANFSDDLQEEILETVMDNLSPNGIFLTFAYNVSLLTKSGKDFRRKLPKFFSSVVRTKTIWANVPPAFIYHAKK